MTSGTSLYFHEKTLQILADAGGCSLFEIAQRLGITRMQALDILHDLEKDGRVAYFIERDTWTKR